MRTDALVLTLVICTGLGTALMKRAYPSNVMEYSSLVNLTEFIDKTLLIKSIFDTEAKRILITVPHRSGKSTNIAMLKRFLEIQIDQVEPVMNTKGLKTPMNDTSNYKLFFLNQLKITKHKSTMTRYFGKFPVLHVDFSNKFKIKDSEQSVVLFRQVIHEAFFEHRYLRQSEKLTTKERRYVKKWCDNYGDYEQFYGQDVTNSLYKLAVILYKHYETKIVVLIDNFDFPTTNAMSELKDAEEFNRVLRFNMGIITKLLSADYKYVKKSVIIGTSYTSTAAIYNLEEVQCFRFLEDHSFASFFGLTNSEVDTIFQKPKFNLTMDDINCALDFYGGFVSRSGRTFINFHSILKFLHFGKFESYCLQSRIVRNLNNLLKIRFIREGIEHLVKGEDVCIPMYENITAEDIMNLNKAISNKRFDSHFNINLLFYFLFEQGYLTYVYPNLEAKITCLKLPNREVRTKISLKLKEYYEKYFLIDKSYLRKCVNFFTKMAPTITINRAHYKMALYWFYKSLEDLIGFVYNKFKKLNLDDVKKIIFSVIFEVNVKENSEFFVDFKESNGIMNIRLFRGKIEYVMHYIGNKTSIYVLQKMLETNKLDEDEILKKDRRNHVYIGLGIDEELHPSLSCLTNSRHIADAIHIP